MVNFKIVLGNKDGKTVQKELGEEKSEFLLGKKIGEKISGDAIGLEGYELEITGGSDISGTPMRKDIEGVSKRKVLCVKGVGVKPKGRGQRQRKTLCGNTISPRIVQVNMKVLKIGKENLFVKGEEQKEENQQNN